MIPANNPNQAADPARVALWRARLPADGFKVGIAWQGHPEPKVDKGRSVPLRAFAPISAVPGVHLISLQKSHSTDPQNGLPEGLPVATLGADFGAGPDALLDIAAVIESLDLVITCDTAAAQVAGALGRPVWIVRQAEPVWRRWLGREAAPAHSTARLFRQRRRGDWDEVFARVAAELAQLVASEHERVMPEPSAGPETPPDVAAAAPLAWQPVDPDKRERTPVIFTWDITSNSGWGIIGLNLALCWAEDPDLLPICAKGFSPGDVAIDRLRQLLLAPAIANAQSLAAALVPLSNSAATVPFPILHGLGNFITVFKALYDVALRGSVNIGVIVLEDSTIDEAARERAKAFSVLVVGSTWNQRLLEGKGVTTPLELVLQGVDPTLFHPAPKSGLFRDRFVVFSGGKLEYRKAQDLVLLAFRAFRARHPEALLVTAWHSPWAWLAASLAVNTRITPVPVSEGQADPAAWAAANGIPAESFLDLGYVPNAQMPQILRECDVALFPNRAEGGTNLVAMECMACGVPCVISANTGHLDLIRPDTCVPLIRQTAVAPIPFLGYGGTEGWGETDVAEAVEALEGIWRDRQRAQAIGGGGAALMATQSWSNQMARLKRVSLPYLR